jgi:hypothetical protein
MEDQEIFKCFIILEWLYVEDRCLLSGAFKVRTNLKLELPTPASEIAKFLLDSSSQGSLRAMRASYFRYNNDGTG